MSMQICFCGRATFLFVFLIKEYSQKVNTISVYKRPAWCGHHISSCKLRESVERKSSQWKLYVLEYLFY